MKARQIIFQGSMVRALIDGRKIQTRRTNGLGDVRTLDPDAWESVSTGPLGYKAKKSVQGRFGATFMSVPGAIVPNTISVCPQVCPYGQPGDLLYVREAFYCDIVPYNVGGGLPNPPTPMIKDNLYYRADGTCCDQIPECECAEIGKPSWRSPIHMPRGFSRLTLQLTDVRVERVQEISEADAVAEGVKVCPKPDGRPCYVWPDSEYDQAGLCHSHADTAFSRGWDSINAARGYGWSENPWVWALTFNVIHANVDDVLAEPGRYLEAA